MIVVGYTGRPQLESCRASLGDVIFVPAGGVCDLGVSIGGSHIFTQEELDRARCGIVNLHFAPLPEYRGRYSAGHALRNGEKEFGATLHYVDAGIDTGPIIASRRFEIAKHETVDTLRARAFMHGTRLWIEWAPRLVEAARNGVRLLATAQDESRAHYYDRHSLALL